MISGLEKPSSGFPISWKTFFSILGLAGILLEGLERDITNVSPSEM